MPSTLTRRLVITLAVTLLSLGAQAMMVEPQNSDRTHWPAHAPATAPLPAPHPGALGSTDAPPIASSRLSEPGGWILRQLLGDPYSRSDSTMAFDPAEGGVVLFSGVVPVHGPLNDTWAYKNGSWVELCGPTLMNSTCLSSPPPREQAEMTYDYNDSELVMYGGCVSTSSGSCFSDATWTFRDGTWTNDTFPAINSTNTPPPDATGGIAYDWADGYVLLFTTSGQSWKFSHGNWSQILVTNPPDQRSGEAFFWDSELGCVLMWGGLGGGPTFYNLNDSWCFKRGTWTQLTPVRTPPGGDVLGSTYDSVSGRGLVYGPTSIRGSRIGNSTWALDTGNWSNLSLTSTAEPNLTAFPSFTFDPAMGVAVLLGQIVLDGQPNQTWILTDPFTLNVTSASQRADAGQSVSYSIAVAGGVLPYRQTFTTSLSQCTTVPGLSNGTSVDCGPQTAGTYWLNISVVDYLNRRLWSNTTFTVNQDPIALGIAIPNPTTLGFPMTFNWSLSGGTPPFNASVNYGDGFSSNLLNSTHIYASPGTYVANLSATDAAGFVVSDTKIVIVNPSLAVSSSDNRSVTDVGLPLGFSAMATGGTSPYVFAWRFGDGSHGTGSPANHSYSATGGFTATLNASDSVGATASDLIHIQINSYPTIQASLNSSAVPVLSPVRFSAGMSGGTPPYSYEWALGDGAASRNNSGTHAYSSIGNYTVTLWANDSVGGSRIVHLAIQVVPAASNQSTPPPPPGFWSTWVPWAAIGAATLLVAGVAVWIGFRRKPRGPRTQDQTVSS